MNERPGVFEELKRRHVWRVAAGYAVASWLLVQVATQLFPFFNVPNWAVRLVVLLLTIGFPVTLVFAWIFEITPEGIRRTAPADSPDARRLDVHGDVGRKLDTFIIAALLCAIGVLGWRLLVLHAPASAPRRVVAASTHVPAKAAPAPAIPDKSVAVLPFTNESGKAGEQYFSDGLSDDLITALAQIDGLKVISRNSAFQFRDSKKSSATIGQALGVAHLLEGSVQRADDEVRITATLVNAADGSTVWSKQYDRPYKDLFALQDAITAAVADALKAKLLTAPGAILQSDRPPNGSLAAFTAYQQGVAYFALGTQASFRQAVAAFTAAIQLDPKYAAAYARLSFAWIGLASEFLSDPKPIKQAWANAREASATARRLDPDSSLAHQTHGYLLLNADFDLTGADVEYQRALQLEPNDPQAQALLGAMSGTLGQNQRAADLTRKALVVDPRHANWYNSLSLYVSALGQLDAAQQASSTAIDLQPDAVSYHEQLAIVEVLRGNAQAALAAAQQEPANGGWQEIALALALQIGTNRAAADAALAKLIKDQAAAAPYQITQVYALRRDPENMFKWLDRAWADRDPGIQSLLSDPLILRYRADPRFAAFCKKVGLPTTTDAVAMK